MKTYSDLIFRISLGIGVILLAIFSALPLSSPRVVHADAPAAIFSAERAMADLEVVAREPHFAGSAAQARVREYIVSQVEALGLTAEIQVGNPVSNILVLLPGSDSTRTVLVTGHYDSHPPAPGAGDNGLSTAAMIEAIRVLHAAPALRNNVLFLFTDGEEMGWLGAIAYLKMNPVSKEEIGVVLCFDGRPGNGPLALQETSPGDSWLIRQMTGLPLAMWAGSWTNNQERGERDTDFSIFSEAGFVGVEIENMESGTRYHTSKDTVDAISPNLMQAFGKTMIALANHFGSIDLDARSEGPDLTYFTLPLVRLVAYPVWIMPILSCFGILALLVCVVIARRQGRFFAGRFLWSLLGLLIGIVFIVMIAQLVWGGIKNGYEDQMVAGVGFEASTFWLSTLMIAAVLVMIALLVVLSRRFGAGHLTTAGMVIYLLVWFAVYLLMDADNPLTTAYVAWPILGGIAGLAVVLFVRNPAWKVALLAICALVILTFTIPQLWLATYTREDAWIPVLATCVPLSLLVPQVDVVFGRAPKRDDDAV